MPRKRHQHSNTHTLACQIRDKRASARVAARPVDANFFVQPVVFIINCSKRRKADWVRNHLIRLVLADFSADRCECLRLTYREHCRLRMHCSMILFIPRRTAASCFRSDPEIVYLKICHSTPHKYVPGRKFHTRELDPNNQVLVFTHLIKPLKLRSIGKAKISTLSCSSIKVNCQKDSRSVLVTTRLPVPMRNSMNDWLR